MDRGIYSKLGFYGIETVPEGACVEVRYRHNVLKTKTENEEGKKKENRAGSLDLHCKSLIGSRERQVSNRKSDFYSLQLFYALYVKNKRAPDHINGCNHRLSKTIDICIP